MPDPFTNARPFYDVTFPSSGDSFLQVTANTKNALQGLGFMDVIPLQPRAHSPGDMRIMVRGRDSGDFFNPYYGRTDADAHLFFTSGDTATMTAPTNNPRIDIVYLTPSGDLRIATGTEAATPTLPALAPSGDTRIPIAAIFHRTTAVRIVNFEDKNANSGDSYIYQDLRPFLRPLGAGGTTLSSTAALSVTGDNAAGTATNASRRDHTHQGVHTVRVVGSGDLFGDVQIEGADARQAGNRIILGHGRYRNVVSTNASDETTTSSSYADTTESITFNPAKEGLVFAQFSGAGSSASGICFFALVVDGAIVQEITIPSGGTGDPVSLSWAGVLSPGVHTIKIQIKNTDGASTLTLRGANVTSRLNVNFPA